MNWLCFQKLVIKQSMELASIAAIQQSLLASTVFLTSTILAQLTVLIVMMDMTKFPG